MYYSKHAIKTIGRKKIQNGNIDDLESYLYPRIDSGVGEARLGWAMSLTQRVRAQYPTIKIICNTIIHKIEQYREINLSCVAVDPPNILPISVRKRSQLCSCFFNKTTLPMPCRARAQIAQNC